MSHDPEMEDGTRPPASTRGRTVVLTIVLGLLTASSIALGTRLYQLDASTRKQADAIAEQTDQPRSVQTDLDSSKSDLDASQRDLDNARSDLARIADQVKRLSGQTKRLDSQRVDVAAVVADTRAAVVTVHCTDSLGSGFALEIGGVPAGRSAIITNHHVISDCTFRGTQASISQGDTTLPAEVWSWDEVNDLALLYVDDLIPTLGAARSFEAGILSLQWAVPSGLRALSPRASSLTCTRMPSRLMPPSTRATPAARSWTETVELWR